MCHRSPVVALYQVGIVDRRHKWRYMKYRVIQDLDESQRALGVLRKINARQTTKH